MNWGQTCISPEVVLVHKDVKEKLLEGLVDTITKFYGKNAHESPDYTKIVSDFHWKRLKALVDDDHGGKVAYKGGDVVEKDRFIPPMIVDSPKEDSKLASGETFGPFLSVHEVDSVEGAVKFINARPKPLAAYYFGDVNGKEKEHFLKHTSSGGVTINECCVHAMSPELPFGGVGFSGTGQLNG